MIVPVTGFIEAVEDRDEGKRLLLRIVDMKDVPEAERPTRARISVRNGEGLQAGLFIGGTARLLPPPQAAWPGGYDFARDAYFKGIGAVGSFSGSVRRLDPPVPPGWSLRLAAQVDEARNALTQRIALSIGGVGAALVTGKRGLIGEPTNDILRGAGIYHIVTGRVCRRWRGEQYLVHMPNAHLRDQDQSGCWLSSPVLTVQAGVKV
jgi:competence protein ComEC